MQLKGANMTAHTSIQVSCSRRLIPAEFDYRLTSGIPVSQADVARNWYATRYHSKRTVCRILYLHQAWRLHLLRLFLSPCTVTRLSRHIKPSPVACTAVRSHLQLVRCGLVVVRSETKSRCLLGLGAGLCSSVLCLLARKLRVSTCCLCTGSKITMADGGFPHEIAIVRASSPSAPASGRQIPETIQPL